MIGLLNTTSKHILRNYKELSIILNDRIDVLNGHVNVVEKFIK